MVSDPAQHRDGGPRRAIAVAIAGLSNRTPRPEAARSLRSALWLVVACSAAFTAVEVAFIWATPQPFPWLQALFAFEGLGTVVAGALAWDRRPANRTGLLLCVLGATILAAAASFVGNPAVAAAGSVVTELPIAALLHLVLAFPSGRLRSRRAVVAVRATYLMLFCFEVPQYVFSTGATAFPGWGLHAHPLVVRFNADIENWVGSALLVLACLDLVLTFHRERRTATAPAGSSKTQIYGVATVLFLPFTAQVLQPFISLEPESLFALQMVLFAWVPVVYVAAVTRSAFGRSGHIETLGAWLAASPGDLADLRPTLAATVGDPSLRLLPWEGVGATPEPADPGRGSLRLDGRDGPLAVVTYDQTLIAEPGLIRSACQLVAVALERHRLSTELLTSRESLRQSRARVVQVADGERRRLARDLHDVLQSRLILAALHAGELAADPDLSHVARGRADDLRRELQDAITDLRHQVQGLMPALLIERGLPEAIEELADRLPIPASVLVTGVKCLIPPAVATAGYSIVSEAFTNSLKHSGATRLDVRVESDGQLLRLAVRDDGVGGADASTGTGLRGIQDRVEVLDGTLTVHSPPGGGTAITVELPCAS